MKKTPMTIAGAEKPKAELQRLKSVERPRIIHAIAEARSHGDLSENAEYHAAKERQGQIEARIRLLEDRLARAQVIDGRGQSPDKVSFGATVVLSDAASGDEVTYTIVGEDEADIKARRIAITAPVARALIGKFVGDTVKVKAPKGDRELEIVDVRFDHA